MKNKLIIIAVSLCVIITLCYRFLTFQSETYEQGIDISEHQGIIDWQKINTKDISFVMIRSSYGTTTDQYFEVNYTQSAKLNLSVGIYHYLCATDEASAIEEANYVIKLLEGKQFDLPVFLDIEEEEIIHLSQDNLDTVISAFINTLENNGYKVGCYTNLSIYLKYLNIALISEHPIWIAQYSGTLIDVPQADYWQYTNTGHIDGIEGEVDLNYKIK